MVTEIDTETEEGFVSLCSDTTFKYFMKEEDTRNWMFELIKRKTGIDLNEFNITDNEINTGNKIKDYRMDLVFEKENMVVIVEMANSSKKADYFKNYQYLYRTEARRFTSGDLYSKKRTILILFNNFKNSENKNILDAHFIFTDPKNKLVINDIESYEIYLPNYKKTCYDKYDEIERRLVLFNTKTFHEMEQITKDKIDLKIIKELRNLSMDEVFLTDYEKEKMQEKLVNSAYVEGKEAGIKQNKIEIAENLLKLNISLNDISKATGLTLEELTTMKQE